MKKVIESSKLARSEGLLNMGFCPKCGSRISVYNEHCLCSQCESELIWESSTQTWRVHLDQEVSE